MAVRLDSYGNIDSSSLEKELQTALEFDVKYKQTDGMKKRAIRVAQSYDDFKNMVACAHQKPVTRQEVESLRDVKKGWQKAKYEKKNETSVLEREKLQQQDLQYDVTKIRPKKTKKPETSMDFDRDWRRLNSSVEKREYLLRTGLKRTSKILRNDLSAEIFQEIIEIVLEETSSQSSAVDSDSVISDPFSWLQSFSTLPRFALMVTFLDRSVRELILNFLSSSRCDLIPSEEREAVISKYSCNL